MIASKKDYVWISELFAIAIHDRQLAEHGGPSGTRDNTLLQSALSKPQNLKAYGEPDLSELAASYAFGIARNTVVSRYPATLKLLDILYHMEIRQ